MSRLATLMAAVLALGLAPALAGCLDLGDDLGLIASSPRQAGGLTVALSKSAVVGSGPSGKAELEILYEGKRVYPPLSFGDSFQVEDGRGIAFVPYSVFVVGNGFYDVRVRFNGEETTARTSIEKWVEYVYLHPYVRGAKVIVDLQLSTARGGAPTDRVIAEGDLRLDIRYRGADGRGNEYIKSVRTTTSPDDTFTRVDIPKSTFQKPGYYSIDAVFHNNQAKGNTWVVNDPTLQDRSPPWNWVYVGP